MDASEDFSSLRAGRPEVYNPGVGGSNRGTAVVLSVFVAVIAAVVWRSGGPSPKGIKAPSNEFSATRAARALRDVLGGNVPHPLGSAAHEAVRERLAGRLRTLGYDVIYQRTFACGGAGGGFAHPLRFHSPAPPQAPPGAPLLRCHTD